MMNRNMALCYDLHSHSTSSDGVLSPSDLLLRAAAQGVDVLALTDHDVTSGIAEARETAESLGIYLIPGVEISVTWNKRLIHILGLGIDPDDDLLTQGLSRLCEQRVWRAKEIGKKFEKIGINGVYEGAKGYSKGNVISRSHFARYLVERNYVSDMQAAFRRYLKHGKRCYVSCQWASLEEAVNWIGNANGQAVIAHPARYDLGNTLMKSLISEFKEIGGVGIEVVTSSHSRKECMAMAHYAKEFNLLASVGSDFHTPDNSWIELGKLASLPEGCEPIWQNWRIDHEHMKTLALH